MKMCESITPPLIGPDAKPVVLIGLPVSSGRSEAANGPVGLGPLASPMAKAFDFCRAVKATQYSSPTLAISGAQKSATREPTAAHSGSLPWGKTNDLWVQWTR